MNCDQMFWLPWAMKVMLQRKKGFAAHTCVYTEMTLQFRSRTGDLMSLHNEKM